MITQKLDTMEARFNDLTAAQQDREYAKFVEMVDQGDCGWHPYYLILVERYQAGDGIDEAEWLAETSEEIDEMAAEMWMVPGKAVGAEYGIPVF